MAEQVRQQQTNGVPKECYPIPDEEIKAAIQSKPKIAENYHLAEVSIRISNPLGTIKFYTGVLGMT